MLTDFEHWLWFPSEWQNILTISKPTELTINITRRRKHLNSKIARRRHWSEVSHVNRAIPYKRFALVFAEIVHRRNFSKRFLLLNYYMWESIFAQISRKLFSSSFLFLILRNNVRNCYIVITEKKNVKKKNWSIKVFCIFMKKIHREYEKQLEEMTNIGWNAINGNGIKETN